MSLELLIAGLKLHELRLKVFVQSCLRKLLIPLAFMIQDVPES